ncbi:MAG: bifunctional glutamine synthetase adenylyltransferase/deadenyltransferase, partial [Halomonas sp.]|nr:bifunctional glutamine synthetase adenylyltransferase/deadenyltransferase [Halomonas sp.]
LKQDAGGMVDIEFLCQYAVLAMSAETPELLTYSDNIRILETLESSGRLSVDEVRQLREAYLTYRHVSHRNALAKQGGHAREADFHDQRQVVQALWQRWLEPEATGQADRE